MVIVDGVVVVERSKTVVKGAAKVAEMGTAAFEAVVEGSVTVTEGVVTSLTVASRNTVVVLGGSTDIVEVIVAVARGSVVVVPDVVVFVHDAFVVDWIEGVVEDNRRSVEGVSVDGSLERTKDIVVVLSCGGASLQSFMVGNGVALP